MAEAVVTRRPAQPSVVANVVRVNPSRPSKKPLTEAPVSPKISNTDKQGRTRNDELRSLLRRVIKKQE